jgi:hypothetical protein
MARHLRPAAIAQIGSGEPDHEAAENGNKQTDQEQQPETGFNIRFFHAQLLSK